MAHLHPLTVHFPIALLVVGVLSDLWQRWHHKERDQSQSLSLGWSTFGLLSTTLGCLLMIPAMVSGLLAHTFQSAPSQDVQDLINLHERLAYLELIVFGGLLVWRWDRRLRGSLDVSDLFHLLMAVGVLMLLYSSFLGGQLVYTHGMGVTRDGATQGDKSAASRRWIRIDFQPSGFRPSLVRAPTF